MRFSPFLIVHVCAGITAVLSGFAALLVRKGARSHRKYGDVFVVSMLLMSASGAFMALMASQRLNVIAGVFTFYLVSSAWLTVKRKENETGRLEVGLLLVALAAGTTGLIFAWQAGHRATGKGGAAAAYVIFGSVAFLSASGDARLLIRGGVAGAKRLVRHLWRMCVALFIAAASFFIGTSGDPVLRRTGLRARLFPEAIRKTHLPEVPVIMILLLMMFWLCRVMFTKAYKKVEP